MNEWEENGTTRFPLYNAKRYYLLMIWIRTCNIQINVFNSDKLLSVYWMLWNFGGKERKREVENWLVLWKYIIVKCIPYSLGLSKCTQSFFFAWNEWRTWTCWYTDTLLPAPFDPLFSLFLNTHFSTSFDREHFNRDCVMWTHW